MGSKLLNIEVDHVIFQNETVLEGVQVGCKIHFQLWFGVLSDSVHMVVEAMMEQHILCLSM